MCGCARMVVSKVLRFEVQIYARASSALWSHFILPTATYFCATDNSSSNICSM